MQGFQVVVKLKLNGRIIWFVSPNLFEVWVRLNFDCLLTWVQMETRPSNPFSYFIHFNSSFMTSWHTQSKINILLPSSTVSKNRNDAYFFDRTGATGPTGADSNVVGPPGDTGPPGPKGSAATKGTMGDKGLWLVLKNLFTFLFQKSFDLSM